MSQPEGTAAEVSSEQVLAALSLLGITDPDQVSLVEIGPFEVTVRRYRLDAAGRKFLDEDGDAASFTETRSIRWSSRAVES